MSAPWEEVRHLIASYIVLAPEEYSAGESFLVFEKGGFTVIVTFGGLQDFGRRLEEMLREWRALGHHHSRDWLIYYPEGKRDDIVSVFRESLDWNLEKMVAVDAPAFSNGTRPSATSLARDLRNRLGHPFELELGVIEDLGQIELTVLDEAQRRGGEMATRSISLTGQKTLLLIALLGLGFLLGAYLGHGMLSPTAAEAELEQSRSTLEQERRRAVVRTRAQMLRSGERLVDTLNETLQYWRGNNDADARILDDPKMLFSLMERQFGYPGAMSTDRRDLRLILSISNEDGTYSSLLKAFRAPASTLYLGQTGFELGKDLPRSDSPMFQAVEHGPLEPTKLNSALVFIDEETLQTWQHQVPGGEAQKTCTSRSYPIAELLPEDLVPIRGLERSQTERELIQCTVARGDESVVLWGLAEDILAVLEDCMQKRGKLHGGYYLWVGSGEEWQTKFMACKSSSDDPGSGRSEETALLMVDTYVYDHFFNLDQPFR